MTTTMNTPRAAAPWWFWAVAALSVLWNAIGGIDYTMSHLQGEAWYRMAGMSEAVIAYMKTYPSWMHAVWAIGVWGSVVGAILLLLRSKWAFHAFAVSMLGALGNLGYTVANGAGVMDPIMPVVICAICGALIWFSWAMTKRGVLR